MLLPGGIASGIICAICHPACHPSPLILCERPSGVAVVNPLDPLGARAVTSHAFLSSLTLKLSSSPAARGNETATFETWRPRPGP
jgi:hypothetical protein